MVRRYTLHIIDLDPRSLSANGWLEDVSKVEKYEMSDEDYNKRHDTFRKYKEGKIKARVFVHGAVPALQLVVPSGCWYNRRIRRGPWRGRWQQDEERMWTSRDRRCTMTGSSRQRRRASESVPAARSPREGDAGLSGNMLSGTLLTGQDRVFCVGHGFVRPAGLLGSALACPVASGLALNMMSPWARMTEA